MTLRKYLQCLWLRAVPYRRLADYIGAVEGSLHYQYLRKFSRQQYEVMCEHLPALVKEHGINIIFRIPLISAITYERLYDIFRNDQDPVMSSRVEATMKGPVWFLIAKAVSAWIKKLVKDGKEKIFSGLRKIKWQRSGVTLEVLKKDISDLDAHCVIISDKFDRSWDFYHKEVFKSLCKGGLKPLFVFFSNRYSLSKENGGYILEIPLYLRIRPRLSVDDKRLLAETQAWVQGFDFSRRLKSKIMSSIRNQYSQYISMRHYAETILSEKIKCLLTFAEHRINHNAFLCQAKKNGCPTVLFYPITGIHELLYDNYESDYALVSNKVLQRKFNAIGFDGGRCRVIGSFDAAQRPAAPASRKLDNVYRIIYFTKGTVHINEKILAELEKKMESLHIDYQLIIKKHPRDLGTYKYFQEKGAIVTLERNFMKFVCESDMIVTQYSGVLFQVLPLEKPLILYTYSDLLEYGERAFFRNAQLPNYFRYAQNKEDLYQAIDELRGLEQIEPLPERLTEDLYGFMDPGCEGRLIEFVNFLVNEIQSMPAGHFSRRS